MQQTVGISRRDVWQNLLVYGTLHLLVDAICVATLFSISTAKLSEGASFSFLVALYGVLAFGFQAPLGVLLDRFRSPRFAVFLGCFISTCAALIYVSFPLLSVILAGLGNALFHIGGGTIILNLDPHNATSPGIFVAPGALGLLIGTVVGKGGIFFVWIFVTLLFVFGVIGLTVKKVEIDYDRKEGISGLNYFFLIFFFLFTAIAFRSLIGFTLVFPWKTDLSLVFLLTLGIIGGKALGGIAADRIGWVRVAVGASLLSIPFLIFGSQFWYLAIIGMMLFNMTMPITMVALYEMFPGRPAYAFGLTCLALLLGAVPVYMGYKYFFESFLISAIIFASASFLNTGLTMLLENGSFIRPKKSANQ